MYNFFKRVQQALFHPQIRLTGEFPWTFGKMAKTYFIASALYILGSLLPVVLFTAFLSVAARINLDWLGEVVTNANGDPNLVLLAGVVAASFLCGFGLELYYISRVFRRDGLSLRKAVGLNLDTLGGSWWSAIWRSVVAFAVVLATSFLLDYLPLPKVHDPAADFARQLMGSSLLLFGLLAVICAPLFEELVFRGFLFNVCRTSFRRFSATTQSVVFAVTVGAIATVFVVLIGKVVLLTLPVSLSLIALSMAVAAGISRRVNPALTADFAAILVSAAVFAAVHMSFTGFPQLLLMGIVLAALYRRSGSLICPMLLHGINNATVFAIMLLSNSGAL